MVKKLLEALMGEEREIFLENHPTKANSHYLATSSIFPPRLRPWKKIYQAEREDRGNVAELAGAMGRGLSQDRGAVGNQGLRPSRVFTSS